MNVHQIIAALEILEFRIHPNLRADAEVKLVLPLGGVLWCLKVSDLRAIQQAIVSLKEMLRDTIKSGDGKLGTDCPYCAVRPPIGAPLLGTEPQCLYCWDTGTELTSAERNKRIKALATTRY